MVKRPPSQSAKKSSVPRATSPPPLEVGESMGAEIVPPAPVERTTERAVAATTLGASPTPAIAHSSQAANHSVQADASTRRPPQGRAAKTGGLRADDTRAERSGSFDGLMQITDAERGRGTSMDAVFKKMPIGVGGVVFSEVGSDHLGPKGLSVLMSLGCCFGGQRRQHHHNNHPRGHQGHPSKHPNDSGVASPAPSARIPSADELPPAAEGWQSALVFLKPHAAKAKGAAALVRKLLASHQIEIVSEGVVDAKRIAEEGKIDAHYGAIANRAVVQPPHALAVPAAGQAAFQMRFGQSWQAALEHGKVFNAAAAAERLCVDALGLEEVWRKIPKDDVLKFGGGFYVGRVGPLGEGPDSPNVFYCVNGFYLQMRAGFVAPGAQVRWFNVKWPASQLSWKRFRSEVIGGTNPEQAAVGSVRRSLLEQWKQLGLPEQPTTGLNGVHASASALEGLFERVNWLSLAGVEADPYGRALVAQANIPAEVLTSWAQDPAVMFEGAPQSVFDLHDGLDAEPCLRRAALVHESNAKAQAILRRSVSRAKQF